MEQRKVFILFREIIEMVRFLINNKIVIPTLDLEKKNRGKYNEKEYIFIMLYSIPS